MTIQTTLLFFILFLGVPVAANTYYETSRIDGCADLPIFTSVRPAATALFKLRNRLVSELRKLQQMGTSLVRENVVQILIGLQQEEQRLLSKLSKKKRVKLLTRIAGGTSVSQRTGIRTALFSDDLVLLIETYINRVMGENLQETFRMRAIDGLANEDCPEGWIALMWLLATEENCAVSDYAQLKLKQVVLPKLAQEVLTSMQKMMEKLEKQLDQIEITPNGPASDRRDSAHLRQQIYSLQQGIANIRRL